MSVFLELVEESRQDGADVSASLTLPDPKTGEKVRVKTAAFPVGDLREVQTWLDAAADGVTVQSKVAVGTGAAPVKIKNLIGDKGTNAVAKLFGVAPSGKPKRKRGGVDDPVLNGTHAE